MFFSPASSFSFWQLLLVDFVPLWSKQQNVANVHTYESITYNINISKLNRNGTNLNKYVIHLKIKLPHHQNHPQRLKVSVELMFLITLFSVARSART